MRRSKAIWYCLYYGILPWFFYEDVCHYSCSYLQHLVINLKYAWRWATFTETIQDREFEKKTNNN